MFILTGNLKKDFFILEWLCDKFRGVTIKEAIDRGLVAKETANA